MPSTHLASLNAKHAQLEAMLNRENQRPVPDSVQVAKLKRDKLRLKEEIAQLN